MTRSRVRRAAVLVATSLTVAVLGAVTLGGGLPAGASPARPSGLPAADPLPDPARTLVATGTARVRGVPDVLTMTIGITSRGSSVGDALDRNNQSVRKVMGVLREGGVDDEDVQTSDFSIGPVYDDRGTEITGYQVSNLVRVQLRDLDAAGDLIDRAAEAGGDDAVMQGVSFGFDDTSALVARARAEAVRRARTQAEQLADAAGVELVAVQTISESSIDDGPVLAAPESSARADSVAIAPGSEELAVQVTVVYTIR